MVPCATSINSKPPAQEWQTNKLRSEQNSRSIRYAFYDYRESNGIMRPSHPATDRRLTDEHGLTSDNNERDGDTARAALERDGRCIFFGDREVQDEYTVTHGPHPSEARGR